MGSDKRWEERLALLQTFQSTLPAGGATGVREVSGDSDFISIHAPRRGSDFGFLRVVNMAINFNPRSPQGERHNITGRRNKHRLISIHAPRRGSDYELDKVASETTISIHAPRRGSDTGLPLSSSVT